MVQTARLGIRAWAAAMRRISEGDDLPAEPNKKCTRVAVEASSQPVALTLLPVYPALAALRFAFRGLS